ncbi:hypothetical protein GE21DRAFT_1281851 [Neurospora crassa]|nr:hypothetical protein GE21DRAFT_1281851 [Neurospora crassa]
MFLLRHGIFLFFSFYFTSFLLITQLAGALFSVLFKGYQLSFYIIRGLKGKNGERETGSGTWNLRIVAAAAVRLDRGRLVGTVGWVIYSSWVTDHQLKLLPWAAPIGESGEQRIK